MATYVLMEKEKSIFPHLFGLNSSFFVLLLCQIVSDLTLESNVKTKTQNCLSTNLFIDDLTLSLVVNLLRLNSQLFCRVMFFASKATLKT